MARRGAVASRRAISTPTRADSVRPSESLKSLFSLVPAELQGDFETLAAHVGEMSAGRRRLLAGRCRIALRRSSVVRDTAARVAVCKVLCAAAPESAAVVHSCLRLGRGRDRYEVQFTLFCFLDRVPNIHRARHFAREIPDLVEE